MNFDYLKVITGRRFPVEYIAPPVCEGEFSSTGSPFISLLPILKEAIETFEVTYQDGVFTFRWDAVKGALCYTVWKLQETDEWEVVAECIDQTEWPTNIVGCYRVTVISDEGVSEPSKMVCTTEAFNCPTFSIALPAGINAEEGTAIVLTVTASTTPAENLNYVWKKDGVVFLSEVLPSGIASSVSKVGLVAGDAGLYRVEVTATVHGEECALIACESLLTVEPFVPPECVDIGEAAPEGEEAFRIPLYPPDHEVYPNLPIPIEWEFFDTSAGTLTETISCEDPPTIYGRRGYTGNTDHPPGAYGVAYVSGYFIHTADIVCAGINPALPTACEVILNALEDEEFFLDCDNMFGQTASLAELWGSSFPPFGNLPPVGSLGEGWSVCSNGTTGVQDYFDSIFIEDPALGPWYFAPVNWHTNTGGNFSFVTQFDPLNDVNSITYQVMQFDGCIQQPRGVRFNDWGAVKFGFPLDVQTWDGTLPTRSVYDYTTLQWDASVGGHTLAYSQDHPTATNGCGWILNVYGSGGYNWRGYKKTGDTGAGIYLRDAAFGAGPTCVLIEEIPVVT